MVLSSQAIKSAVQKSELDITPFDEKNLKPASYTFTLAARLLIPKKVSLIVMGGEQEYEEVVMGLDGFVLQPGDFVLGFTAEHLALKNNYACFLSARGSCAQAGLSVLLSSSFAEPDTDNPIILEIHNAGKSPIRLEAGMKIVKGIFMPVEEYSE
ncbi:MAG: hypothetical protein PHX30_00280 [Candidatus Pacebacteria bacterium]|nr:hypothetical protein [Candidatus Paceibacterota bacterium]